MGDPGEIALFLCGDVMPGRGIDQALPSPCDPAIDEMAMSSAAGYVELAELANGPIARPLALKDIWGDALDELARREPDWRIVNLETAVTRRGSPMPKGINYRVSPENFACIPAARIDCCVLANNHVLDWGTEGLSDTLETIDRAGIRRTGAGRDLDEAAAPAILDGGGKGRVLVFAAACASSGVPRGWAAADDRPGIHLLPDLSVATARRFAHPFDPLREPGDLIVVSLHWGGNWGYSVPRDQRNFAHALIDAGAADILHGHSSHHPRGIERYRDRLVLYGCGDFLNDYEGISGREKFRSDLVLMYLPRLRAGEGALVGLDMVPFRIRNFRLNRATAEETDWLAGMMARESRHFDTAVEKCAGDCLTLALA